MKGTILKNFDLDSIRKQRARKAASGGVNLEDAINQISPEIGQAKQGDTVKLEIPNGTSLRKFVMSITAKLNNLTPKDGAWEGRTYRVVSDGERFVYVQRGNDEKNPPVRARRGGGRRSTSASTGGSSKTTVEGGAVVTENA